MIPDLALELEDVSGEIDFSWGILQATNLAARMGHVVGQNSVLDLDLTQTGIPKKMRSPVH